ncbi:MAG: glycoside hydrolase family 3 C-terminal domain-containing protein [Candidatus Binatia bacterium]|nr:glycoside hydrolase family 3 C-terminal domain-containing protein [Candidatus Binatia bacterium]
MSAEEANDDPDREQAFEKVAAMTLKEKVGLMSGRLFNMLLLPFHHGVMKQYNRSPYHNSSVKRLDVPSMRFCDGPRGVVSQNSTCFPVAMARGATFDTALEERVGKAIAKEIIAAGGNFFGGVCINLLRHPAWGRAQETYGEDPHLLGRMGVAVTEGVQSLGVMACVKHFALNSMENARFKVDVTCSERTLREVYLPHFKECVDAGAASVMTAYNKVHGEYCGQNEMLIRGVLKGEWGFEGFVISDFVWGIHDTAQGAQNGMDVEMPWPTHFGRKLLKAVKSGRVAEKHVDEAALRIVSTILRFDEVLQENAVDPSVVACEEHRQLARTVAEKSMTLLKNDNGVLPLRRRDLKRVAVIGELADTANVGDHGSSKVVPPYAITPLDGLRTHLGSDVEIDYCPGTDLAAVTAASQSADAVVLVVGNRHSDEGEYIMNSKRSPGGDRDELSLRESDVEQIKAAARGNPNTVVVLIGGSAITTSEWEQDVAAILFAYYPGMEGGNALAATLFGDVNPGGKLPFTIPTDSAHLPFFDKEAESIEYGYYHGYTLLDREAVEPAYAFGWGGSYTRFELSAPAFSADGDQFRAGVTVRNSGECAGDEVVQLYVGCSQSSVDRPKKVLRDFERVSLQPGESIRVELSVDRNTMRWYDEADGAWRLEAVPYDLHIGTSSRDQDLSTGVVSVDPLS